MTIYNFKKITLFVLLAILLSLSQNTFALKRASFPDSKSLQPMPANTAPNISHNVNATPQDFSQTNLATGTAPVNSIVNVENSQPPVEVGSSGYIWTAILSILFGVFVFFCVKKFLLY
jgi:hypothetical protein